MTTIFEDAPDHTSGGDEAGSGEERPRLRRFAPRKSRSAGAPSGIIPTSPAAEPVSAPEPQPAASPEIIQPVPVSAESTPAEAAETSAVEPAPATRPQIRRSRSRRPTAGTAQAGIAGIEPAVAEEAALTAVSEAQPSEITEPPVPVAKETPKSRGPRSRSKRPAIAAEVEQPAEGSAEPIAAIQTEAPVEPAGAAEAAGDSPEAAPRAAPARRTRRRTAAPAAEKPATVEPVTEAAAVAPAMPAPDLAAESAGAVHEAVAPAENWFPEGEMIQTAPGGDLDGTEALARALLEMFPAEAATAEAEEGALAADEEETADLAPTDVLAEAQAILEGRDAEETDETDLPRRRNRRGRRGGRGRKRGGLTALPSLGEEGSEPPQLEDEGGPAAAAPEVTPLTGGAAETPFVPESPPRGDRPWRERGPRRLWGRTYGRELSPPVTMPPPKPSNGARFAPIPQAAPPLSALAEPEVALSGNVPFVMPDLRLDAPLAPGETRTERLLEAQTRLMQAMLEQQTRQIEVLTTSVNSLRQSVNQLSAGGAVRTYQPRTGIFVDAPNVCYAAENARVNLDFGRMLKYLSRDRYLVHAFAYSPIIDDVREGIRYETQRFVAPFLRSGYKLVTKPLKRFSDGSAKGNFDIELAVDIVTMSERLDLVVLVSGDSDFERMIELIQSRGVRVEVVAFASNVSTELVNIADVFIDINQHLEHLRAL